MWPHGVAMADYQSWQFGCWCRNVIGFLKCFGKLNPGKIDISENEEMTSVFLDSIKSKKCLQNAPNFDVIGAYFQTTGAVFGSYG